MNVSTQFVVSRDEDDELMGPRREQTSYELPYLAVHAVQAVRDAARDNPIEPGQAVETNEQLMDVAVFAKYLLPPPPATGEFA